MVWAKPVLTQSCPPSRPSVHDICCCCCAQRRHPFKMIQTVLKLSKQIIATVAVLLLCAACTSAPALTALSWEVIQLPTEAAVLDVSFGETDHGWLVGSDSTLMETLDGGRSWQSRPLALDNREHRFTSVSFAGPEGWVVGEPTILLHTTDGGSSWSQIPLSPKLPGTPKVITALGNQAAEMTTDQGAIYRTQDSGQHWEAMVEESFGITSNIRRSEDGKYVAVSSRGNFYSIWEPGRKSWEPYNRNNSRKLQSMGFDPDDHLWMISRGGQLQFSASDLFTGVNEWQDPFQPQRGSIGLLDLAYRTPNEIWAAGGSGTCCVALMVAKPGRRTKRLPRSRQISIELSLFRQTKGLLPAKPVPYFGTSVLPRRLRDQVFSWAGANP